MSASPRALGWAELHWTKPNEQWGYAVYFAGGLALVGVSPEGKNREVPDYAHSLDACLPVLAALREKGWFWAIDQFWRGKYVATMGNWNNTDAHFEATADDPAAALAECIATILETEKSPD